jgi:AcrR family transcriptional regulator
VTDRRDPLHAQLFDARRNQILDAATQVFAEKGFHGATIKEIARLAGIADGTIYIYFKNKPDLFLAILERLNEKERQGPDLAEVLGGEVDFRKLVTAIVRHRLTVMNDNLRAFQAVFPDILANAELRERYLREVIEPSFKMGEPIFEQMVANGVVRPLDAAITLRAVSSMFLGMLVLRMMGDSTTENAWADLPEVLTGLIFDGLEKEKSR